MPDVLEGKGWRWFSPYIKVYSLGGVSRCAEISTYPRAYKDTEKHIYTVDTPFVVTQDDYNFQGLYPNSKYHLAQHKFIDHGLEHTWYGFADETEKFYSPHEIPQEDLLHEEGYQDTHFGLHKIGEITYHFTGESLPGAFPLWLESDTLPFTPEREDLLTFFCDGLPYPMASVSKAEVNKGDGWNEIPLNILKNIRDQIKQLRRDTRIGIFVGKFSILKEIVEKKILIRIYYEKVKYGW